jgi:hypothetical protein
MEKKAKYLCDDIAFIIQHLKKPIKSIRRENSPHVIFTNFFSITGLKDSYAGKGHKKLLHVIR